MERLVNVYRGREIESFHSGAIAVVDATGRLVAHLGDPQLKTFLRSAAKPFQILPLLEAGGGGEFDLAGEETALICASHGGTPQHVAVAAAILRKGEFDESDLLCGAHDPYDEKAAAELRQTGEQPSALHNNCSGKHAGMLLACQLMDAPPATYLEADHPLQKEILDAICRFTSLPAAEIPLAIDGCGVPSYYLSLYRAAFAYARFAATSLGMTEGAGGIPDYTASARDVVGAMTSHPFYVAGSQSMTTPLMESFGKQVLGKEGAEAFYSMAIFPTAEMKKERPGLFGSGPIGVALKVADGSAVRARDPVVLRTLEQLGISVADKPLLQQYRDRHVYNVAGRLVGQIRAEFELEFL
ncbi:MAG TPA: asparaginase [Thermoanaerobaculia bacterium]|nr:asparaginase [Thermoanaerobaculia bacterium]